MDDLESKAPLPHDNWLFEGKAFGRRQPPPQNYNLLDIQSIESIVPSFAGTGFRLYQSKSSTHVGFSKRVAGLKRDRSALYEPSASVPNLPTTKDETFSKSDYYRYRPDNSSILTKLGLEATIYNNGKKKSFDPTKMRKAWAKMQRERKRQVSDMELLDQVAQQETEQLSDFAGAERKQRELQETFTQKQEMAKSLGISAQEMDLLDAHASRNTDGIMEKYKEAFKSFDTDGSGTIDRNELRGVLENGDQHFSEAELDKFLNEADTDGDGTIDYDEFCAMMAKQQYISELAMSMSKTVDSRGGRSRPDTSQSELFSDIPVTGFALPPLKLDAIRQSKRHIVEAGFRKSKKPRRNNFVDEHYSRPTPHCLHNGTKSNASMLRRQLNLAKNLVHELDNKVKEDVKWVQENCPITNIRAQMFCKKWGFEKMNNLMKKIKYKKQMMAFHQWQKASDQLENEQNVQKYMKWKASRKLVKMFDNWEIKQMFSGWTSWIEEVERQRNEEALAAAVEIERAVRGHLGRQKAWRRKRNLNAIIIQKHARGNSGRRVAAKLRQEKLEWDSATMIQNNWRGYEGRKLARVVAKQQRELKAATCVQRAYRGFAGRRICRVIARQQLEIRVATMIQCMWRTRVARRLISSMKQHIREEEAALLIQVYWRTYCLKCEAKERVGAIRREFKRQEAAMCIQCAWRTYKAKKLVQETRLLRAALRVQCAWRCKQGRMSTMLLRQAKLELAREEKLAASRIQSVFRGKSARKKLREKAEKEESALKMQCMFRGKQARKELSNRQYLRDQRTKERARQELENLCALRVQRAWRGKQGRLSYHLKMQARRARDEEERIAALRIQTRYRSHSERATYLHKQEESRNAAKIQALFRGKKERAYTKQLKLETDAACSIQTALRGKFARQSVEATKKRNLERANAAMKRKQTAMEENAALRIQAQVRGNQSRLLVFKKKKKIEIERKRIEEEALKEEQEVAALLIQQQVRSRLARIKLKEKKAAAMFEMMAEKDDTKRAKLKEKHLREQSALKLQQAFRARKAREELSKRKAASKEKKQKALAELQKQADEVIIIKIQSKMRQYLAKKAVQRKQEEREFKAKMLAEEDEKIQRDVEDRELAAIKIQSMYRAKRARQKVQEIKEQIDAEKEKIRLAREAREEEEKKEDATLKMQSMFRMKKARDDVTSKRKEHEEELAKLQRENADQATMEAIRLRQEQEIAAIRVQSVFRQRKARKIVMQKRTERDALETKKLEDLEKNRVALTMEAMHQENIAKTVDETQQALDENRAEESKWIEYWVFKFQHNQNIYLYLITMFSRMKQTKHTTTSIQRQKKQLGKCLTVMMVETVLVLTLMVRSKTTNLIIFLWVIVQIQMAKTKIGKSIGMKKDNTHITVLLFFYLCYKFHNSSLS